MCLLRVQTSIENLNKHIEMCNWHVSCNRLLQTIHKGRKMSQGIYIALSGAKLQQRRLELLSNNLANANTTGYKTDNISAASFEIALDEYMTDDGNFNNLTYTKTGQVSTDFSKGSMKNTGSPLNLALDGPGFFCS